MAKIFDTQDWLKNHPNRNNFDLTHKYHGSFQFGKLYPVLMKPVVPTDSFRIDTACSFRFTPMPFPTQSNMRVIFHYFYVRNKNIWKNFPNWLQQLPDNSGNAITPPYIPINSRNQLKRSGLLDYLDVPTSFSVSSSVPASRNFYLFYTKGGLPSGSIIASNTQNLLPVDFTCCDILNNYSSLSGYYIPSLSFQPYSRFVPLDSSQTFCYAFMDLQGSQIGDVLPRTITFSTLEPFSSELNPNLSLSKFVTYDTSGNIYHIGDIIYSSSGVVSVSWRSTNWYTSSLSSLKFAFLAYIESGVSVPIGSDGYIPPFTFNYITFLKETLAQSIDLSVDGNVPYSGSVATSQSVDNSIPLSALPLRAYESIYRAFYANSQGVQPFLVNGVPQYNKYVTNDGDGADTTDYHLFEKNWELDAYTSCLLTPQQMPQPYVGITEVSALGNMRVETPDGESAEVRLSDNGEGVDISDLHGDTPEARRFALRAASSGFTIPEFREANAMQRFMEMNLRKGYKYIDFIEGHFGKKPTYAEMDMPEFLGGFTQRIAVNEVSQSTGLEDGKLGAIAGQARGIGGSRKSVTRYFDDFGWIVGIMCLVPDNAYDCVLPKHYNLTSPLDMYFPEFSNLSYQPLTHQEFCPVQTANDPRGSSYRDLTKVFGYQRPNHDLVWYPDTVHGLFRDATGIGNSVICRRFSQRPELSDEFLRINPSEADTIFNYTFGDEDVCLGEIVFKISAKRPVPRLVVPSL